MKVSKKKLAASVAAGAVTLAGAGVAYAYWTGTGSGSGSATAASEASNSLILTASASDLVPGGGVDSDGVYTIPVKAENDGPTSIAVDTLDMDTFTAGTDCDAVSGADAVANDPTDEVVVAAGDSDVEVGTVTVTFPDSTTVDQGACKGAEWTFNLSASHS